MAKKNQPSGGDPNTNEAFLFVGLILIVFMLWMAYHTRIAALVLAIRGAEAWIISLFTYNLEELRGWMKHVPRSSVSAGQLIEVSSVIGSYTRWFFSPLLLFYGIWLFRRSPTEKFKTIFTDKTLPVRVARLYPWMRISITNDFASMDMNKGNWAIARTERQFARMHKLRNENGELDRDRAASVFIKQLGSLWMGYGALRPHAKALFALFAARMNKDFVIGDRLLMQLANSSADGKIDYTGVDEIAQKFMDSKLVKRSIQAHAYERTILMTMLERARGGESGKDYLPPNWFLWLKGIDRGLWYALSDVGRRTYHVESAGVFSHWLAERARKKRLEMPWVKNAVDGFAAELAKFVNDDDTEEGLIDSEDLIEIDELPPAPHLPSPETVENAMKSGRSSSLPKLPFLSNK